MDLVYWDSNAFLGLIGKEPDKYQACENVWKAAQNEDLRIVTSTLTIAEVIYSKGIPKMDPEHRSRVNAFFRQLHMALEPLTRLIAELARDVVWDHSIKAKDAVHVATAAYHEIPVLHTFDEGLLRLETVSVNGFTLRIIKPHVTAQAAFDMK